MTFHKHEGASKANNRRWKKSPRYIRWASKAAFLILFLIPIAYVPSSQYWQTPWTPVKSLIFQPAKPYFSLPLVESPCTIWLSGWSNPALGSWIVEPLGAIQALLTSKVDLTLTVPTLFALFIAVTLVILLGTAFCSWVCPIGTVVDSFDKFVEKFLPKIEAKRAEVYKRNVQLRESTNSAFCKSCFVTKAINNQAIASGVLIGSFVAAPLLGFNAFCTICPIGISTRSLFHLKATTFLTKTLNPFFIELLAIPAVAILLSLRERRFWCNKLCPVGALLGGIASLNPFIKPKVNQKKCIMYGCPDDCKDYRIGYCGACRLEDDRKCEKVCPANINLFGNGPLNRCTKCFECYMACEHGAIEMHKVGKPDIYRVGGYLKKLRARRRKKQNAPATA